MCFCVQQYSWRIGAKEAKALARVSFEADISGLYSGMVYLKSEYDNQVGVPVNLALPVRITARTGKSCCELKRNIVYVNTCCCDLFIFLLSSVFYVNPKSDTVYTGVQRT